MTYPHVLPLDGAWRLLPVDSFRQGFYPLDDDAWIEQELPAHWQQHPLLERYAGKLVYRKRFALADGGPRAASEPGEPPAARYWLRLNGIFYWSQPYFNGVDLGRHEGYFMAQEHEVTPWIAGENTLVVEVECPEEHDKLGKRLITGVFSHWDCLDPATNPGGIWLPVELIGTGPTRIAEVLLDAEIEGTVAHVRYRATLDAAQAGPATLRWTFAPHNFAGEIQEVVQRYTLQQGAQEIAGRLEIRDPQLWWTYDMGHPNLYQVTLEVLDGAGMSDAHRLTYGFRRFSMRNWIPYLNGVRFFAKGNNYPPADMRLAAVTPERCAEDLRLAQACHMNMLRVHAHIEHPAFYEAADAAGILLWQDFPLQWLYRRSVLPEARRQVRAMIRQLYNHPAIVLWCMHNEPIYIADTQDQRVSTALRTYASVFVWSWNRDVMDTQLKRVAEAEDATRPAVRASGEYAVPLLRAGTDSHFYYGWYSHIYGPLRAWEPIARRFPNNIRFVTEFGAQSFPNRESCLKFMVAEVEQIDWQHLTARYLFQPGIMDRSLDWRGTATLEELVQLTQDYQSAVNRFYIDRLRYYKYRPTGGILPFMFHDPNPAVSFSILDYWRVPKRSYDAMRQAFSPQYVFTLLAQDSYPIGAPIDLPIYIVNDAQYDVAVEVVARLLAPDQAELARVARALTLPADCMAMEAERLRLTPDAPGDYQLELSLCAGDGREIAHGYTITVAAQASDASQR